LCEARSDVAERGLVAGTARLWTGDGRLIASGAQQMFSRPLPD
jgi:acyl-CoA thioesterase